MNNNDTLWRTATIGWFAVIICLICLQFQFFNKRDFATDLSTLRPSVELDDARIAAHRRLSDSVDRRLVIMVGFPNKDEHHVSRYLAKIQSHWQAPSDFYPSTWHALQIDSQLSHFRDEPAEQMTIADQRWMVSASLDEYLSRALNHFIAIGKVPSTTFSQDPLGTFEAWVTKRQYHHPIEPAEGHWKLYTDDYIWSVMIFQSDRDSLRKPSLALYDNITQLRQIAYKLNPDAKVLVQGQPYLEADMAHAIQRDMKLLYVGLLLFMSLLTAFFFKSTKAVVLILASMLVSVASACCLTMAVIGHLHYWVFFIGSLIAAVTASWTCSYFIIVSQREHPSITKLQSYLAKRLGLSMMPLLIGSALLLMVNHPIVEQIGLVFVFGLAIAYFNSVLCLPYLVRSSFQMSPNLQALVHGIKSMPKLTFKTIQRSPAFYLTTILFFCVFVSMGIGMLKQNQTRQHITTPSVSVQAEENTVSELLQLPSSTRYFLIRGNTPEQLLMNEEAFRHALIYHNQPELKVTCITKWYPSDNRRESIRAFNEHAYERIKTPIKELLGVSIDSPKPLSVRPDFNTWIQSSEATPVANLFLKLPQGYGSIVEIAGLKEDTLPTLNLINEQQPSATFIDFEADHNDMVDLNRSWLMGMLFLLVVIQSTFALFYFGQLSWRVSVPPILSVATAVAFIGLSSKTLLFYDMIAIVFGYCASLSFAWRLCSKFTSETLSAVAYSCISLIICGYLVSLSSNSVLSMFGLTLSLVMCTSSVLLPFLSYQHTPVRNKHSSLHYVDMRHVKERKSDRN